MIKQKIKMFLCLGMLLSLLCGYTLSHQTNAQPSTHSAIRVMLDGVELSFDVPPKIVASRTLVPMRVVFEALGMTVIWNGQSKTIEAKSDDKTLLLTVDKKEALVNQNAVSLEVSPQIESGRTLIPLRFVAESIGATVSFDDQARVITIQSKQKAFPKIRLHMIDVGQGDAILIQTTHKENILVDAGDNDHTSTLMRYLQNQGVKKLHTVVGTHPHADHIGGMDEVLQTFDFDTVWFPKIKQSDLKSVERVDKEIKKKGKTRNIPLENHVYAIDGISLTILSDTTKNHEDVNDDSLVILVTCGANTILLTGDAERVSEEEMLQKNRLTKVDVLKVGHHGSSSSTTDHFLKALSPQTALISVGKDNPYKHPATSTVNRLKKANIPFYQTEQEGNILLDGNGQKIFKKNAS